MTATAPSRATILSAKINQVSSLFPPALLHFKRPCYCSPLLFMITCKNKPGPHGNSEGAPFTGLSLFSHKGLHISFLGCGLCAAAHLCLRAPSFLSGPRACSLPATLPARGQLRTAPGHWPRMSCFLPPLAVLTCHFPCGCSLRGLRPEPGLQLCLESVGRVCAEAGELLLAETGTDPAGDVLEGPQGQARVRPGRQRDQE